MYVKTVRGARCPKEGKPREYIGESPEEVADSAYYRRLLADGSLMIVDRKSAATRQDNKQRKDRTMSDPPAKED